MSADDIDNPRGPWIRVTAHLRARSIDEFTMISDIEMALVEGHPRTTVEVDSVAVISASSATNVAAIHGPILTLDAAGIDAAMAASMDLYASRGGSFDADTKFSDAMRAAIQVCLERATARTSPPIGPDDVYRCPHGLAICVPCDIIPNDWRRNPA